MKSFYFTEQWKSLKQIFYVILLFSCTLTIPLLAQDAPFNAGINLTNWFQVPNAKQIQFTKYTKKDFEQIKSLGCDVIRLPINLHYMTNGAPNYTIDPIFFNFLDEVIKWSEDLGIHLILDNHTFSPSEDTDPEVGEILEKVWIQMAAHYRNSTDLLYYEILNEPHGIDDAVWNSIQQNIVQKIRDVDTKHTIIIGPAGWNSFHNLDDMPVYNDDNLIYTFHFYDPFIFTHQGASWTNPSMAPLADVPFPYAAGEMPVFPDELKDTWIESSFLGYHNDGTVAKVQEMLDIAIDFMETRQVPLFCGEFGVYIPNSNNSDRVYWYEIVRTYLEQNGIGWTIWDYHGGFGLFEEGGNNLFDHDLNVPLLTALAFNVPPQSDYQIMKDSAGFIIYTDYTGEKIHNYSWGSGLIDYYAKDMPNNGNYCLKWSKASQYEPVGFDFVPNKDLSYLVENDYVIDFFVRGDIPEIEFDLRFVDTKTNDVNDHPWRMAYRITKNDATWNSKWQHLRILLKNFTEQGSYDNGWFNPQGDFDWSDVDKIEIVAEPKSLEQANIWFDNVIITNVDTAKVNENGIFEEVLGFENPVPNGQKVKVYPNPVTDELFIEFDDMAPFSYFLYDVTGKIVIQSTSTENVKLSLANYKSGLYFVKVVSQGNVYYADKIFKR